MNINQQTFDGRGEPSAHQGDFYLPSENRFQTGAFVEDPDVLYNGEHDPLTLDEWENVQQPLALQGDVRHFYQPSENLFELRYNPLTRTPLRNGIGDFHPIVHRNTRYYDYLNLLRNLRERGWAYPERIVPDMQGLHAATAHEEEKGSALLLWQKMQQDGLGPEQFAYEMYKLAGQPKHRRYHPREH